VKSKFALVVALVALALGATLVAAQAAVAQTTGPGAGNDVGQDQSAGNTNSSTQSASATADTTQSNSYTPSVGGSAPAPVATPQADSIVTEQQVSATICDRCFNGDVSQSNDADTKANAENSNETDQSNDQSQSAGGGDATGPGAGDDVHQTQSAGNTNSTTQSASSDATTTQSNSSSPSVGGSGTFVSETPSVSLTICDRCFNGEVSQSNDGDTKANA
jgi:hypothetical protein